MAATTDSALDLVRRYYDLIDRGDLDDAFELFDVDAEVTFGDHPTLRGRDAVAERVRSMVIPVAKSVAHEIKRPYEFAGPGDRTTVIVEADVVYTMLHSGNVIPHNAVMISEVDPSGKIVIQRNVGDLRPVIEDHAANAPA
jgi:hypothetical protein